MDMHASLRSPFLKPCAVHSMHRGEKAQDEIREDIILQQVMNASRFNALELHFGVYRPAIATITETTAVNGGVRIDDNNTKLHIVGAPTRTKFPVLPQDEGGKELDTPITVQGRSAIQHGAGDAASISTNTNDYMQLPDNHSALDSGCSTMIVTSLLDTKHCAAGPSNIMQAKDGSVTRADHKAVKTCSRQAQNGDNHSKGSHVHGRIKALNDAPSANAPVNKDLRQRKHNSLQLAVTNHTLRISNSYKSRRIAMVQQQQCSPQVFDAEHKQSGDSTNRRRKNNKVRPNIRNNIDKQHNWPIISHIAGPYDPCSTSAIETSHFALSGFPEFQMYTSGDSRLISRNEEDASRNVWKDDDPDTVEVQRMLAPQDNVYGSAGTTSDEYEHPAQEMIPKFIDPVTGVLAACLQLQEPGRQDPQELAFASTATCQPKTDSTNNNQLLWPGSQLAPDKRGKKQGRKVCYDAAALIYGSKSQVAAGLCTNAVTSDFLKTALPNKYNKQAKIRMIAGQTNPPAPKAHHMANHDDKNGPVSVTSDINERATGLVSVTSNYNERATGTVHHIINPAPDLGQQPGEAAAHSPAALGHPTADKGRTLLHRKEGDSSQGLDPTLADRTGVAVTARNENDDNLHARKPPKMEGVRQEAVEQYNVVNAVAPPPRYGIVEPSFVRVFVPRTEGPTRSHDVPLKDKLDRKVFLEGLVLTEAEKDFYDSSPNSLCSTGPEVVCCAWPTLRDPSLSPRVLPLGFGIGVRLTSIPPGARLHAAEFWRHEYHEFSEPCADLRPLFPPPCGGARNIIGKDLALYASPQQEQYKDPPSYNQWGHPSLCTLVHARVSRQIHADTATLVAHAGHAAPAAIAAAASTAAFGRYYIIAKALPTKVADAICWRSSKIGHGAPEKDKIRTTPPPPYISIIVQEGTRTCWLKLTTSGIIFPSDAHPTMHALGRVKRVVPPRSLPAHYMDTEKAGKDGTVVTIIKTPPVDHREEYPDSATNVNLPCYPKRVIAATINMLDGFSTYVPTLRFPQAQPTIHLSMEDVMQDTSSKLLAQLSFPWDTMAQAHTPHTHCLVAPYAPGGGDASNPPAGIGDIHR